MIPCRGPYGRSLPFGYPIDGVHVNRPIQQCEMSWTRPTRQEKPTGLISFANGQYGPGIGL